MLLLLLACTSPYSPVGPVKPADDTGGDPPADTASGGDPGGACPPPDATPSVEVAASCRDSLPAVTLTPAWTAARLAPVTALVAGDLDGDGASEIVYSDATEGIVAVDVRDGSPRWSYAALAASPSSPALADIDGDGLLDVVARGGLGSAALSGIDGHVIWETTGALSPIGSAALRIVDLDGDGADEIVQAHRIFSAANGQQIGAGAYGEGCDGFCESAVADLDGDGTQEVIAANAAYDPRGNALWSNGQPDGPTVVVDLDDDGALDILVSADGGLRRQRADGWIEWSVGGVGTSPWGSGAAVADLDGDGTKEIVFDAGNALVALGADGEVRWTAALDGGGLGVTAFDVEPDGAAELLVLDAAGLQLFDGATGALRTAVWGLTRSSLGASPLVLDADGDGTVEVAVGDYGDAYGSGGSLRLFRLGPGQARSDWAYAGLTVASGVRVATAEDAVPTGVGADAVPVLEATCEERCEAGEGVLWVGVGNGGTGQLPAGVAVTAFTWDGETPVPLASGLTVAPVRPGAVSPPVALVVPSADVIDGTIEVRVDADPTGVGALDECFEDDNRLFLPEAPCP